jgi:hypothetical protein
MVIDLPEFDTGQYEGYELKMAEGGAVLTLHIAEEENFILNFHRVRWHQFTADPNCSVEMINNSYFKLTEVFPSRELDSFLGSDRSTRRAYKELHHYRIYLDGGGCHEFFAESVHAGL